MPAAKQEQEIRPRYGARGDGRGERAFVFLVDYGLDGSCGAEVGKYVLCAGAVEEGVGFAYREVVAEG